MSPDGPLRDGAPRSSRRRWLLWGLWAFLALVLVAFHRVLLSFAVAVVIAYLLEPAVERLSRVAVKGRQFPRWVAVVGLYVVAFGLVYLFSLTALPRLYKEVARAVEEGKEFVNALTPERVGAYSRRLESWLTDHGVPLALGPAPDDGSERPTFGLSFDLEQALRDGLDNVSELTREHLLEAVGLGQKVVSNAVAILFRFFFVLMVAAFLLIDWDDIGRYSRRLVPDDRVGQYDLLLAAIDRRLAGVVRGQAIICLINGVLTFVGLVLLDVKFAFILSIIAMVLSAIPIFGSILSSIPIVLVGLTQGWHTGLGALGWILGIHALEAYLLNPKIMGAHAHIHPVLVAFSLLAGEATFGFVGALFAVPVAAILVALFEFVHARAHVGAPPGAGA